MITLAKTPRWRCQESRTASSAAAYSTNGTSHGSSKQNLGRRSAGASAAAGSAVEQRATRCSPMLKKRPWLTLFSVILATSVLLLPNLSLVAAQLVPPLPTPSPPTPPPATSAPPPSTSTRPSSPSARPAAPPASSQAAPAPPPSPPSPYPPNSCVVIPTTAMSASFKENCVFEYPVLSALISQGQCVLKTSCKQPCRPTLQPQLQQIAITRYHTCVFTIKRRNCSKCGCVGGGKCRRCSLFTLNQ